MLNERICIIPYKLRNVHILSTLVISIEGSSNPCIIAIPYRYNTSITGNWGLLFRSEKNESISSITSITVEILYIEIKK